MGTDSKKDVMIKFNSVTEGKNSKGGDRITLRMTPEDAANLASVASSEEVGSVGMVLDVHISTKTAEKTGREFRSAIAFARAKQTDTGTNSPVLSVNKADTKARIAALTKAK